MSCGCGIFEFCAFAGSGEPLRARITLPDDTYALLGDIASIDYEVYNITDGGAAVTGSLVLADVMLAALAEWDVDSIGYGFNWAAPGSLWPLEGKVYRVILTFVTSVEFDGFAFKLAWQVETTNLTS